MKIKNAAVHYFTGTGNSSRAARLIAASISENGYKSKLIDVERARPEDCPPVELNIFVCPVYATALPLLMERYLKRLPSGKGARAAVIAIHGELKAEHTVHGYAGQTLMQGERLLKKRGYKTIYTERVGYPVNWTTLGPTPKPEVCSLLLEAGDKVVNERVIPALLEGKKSLYRVGLFNLFWTAIFGILFNIFGRHFYGKLRLAGDSCNGCSICAKLCPTTVIMMKNGHPRWKINCLACERCLNICPQQAIYTSLPRAINLLISALLPLIFIPSLYGAVLKLLSPYLPAPLAHSLDVVVVAVAVTLLSLLIYAPIDLLLTNVEHLPFLKKVLLSGFNKKHHRYIEPGFRKELLRRAKR